MRHVRLTHSDLDFWVDVRLRVWEGKWLAVADLADEPEVGIGVTAREAIKGALGEPYATEMAEAAELDHRQTGVGRLSAVERKETISGVVKAGEPIPVVDPSREWVKLDPAEADAFPAWLLVRGDLNFAGGVVTRLLAELPTDEAGHVALGEDGLQDVRARWNGAVMAYARAFDDPRAEILEDYVASLDAEARERHDYFMNLRNQYIAHRVADFERSSVLISPAPWAPRLPITEVLQTHAYQGLERMAEFHALTQQAFEYVEAQCKSERERIRAWERAQPRNWHVGRERVNAVEPLAGKFRRNRKKRKKRPKRKK